MTKTSVFVVFRVPAADFCDFCSMFKVFISMFFVCVFITASAFYNDAFIMEQGARRNTARCFGHLEIFLN